MPIKIPANLPAYSILKDENAFVMSMDRAIHQDIRELKILILNLMPKKIETETQFARILSNSALQIEVEFLKLSTYTPNNISQTHLFKFYKNLDEIKKNKYDGMIITGAPIEQMKFEDVAYWDELKNIMTWADKNVTSVLYLCWAAQAGLYFHFDIKKYTLDNDRKISGIFKHQIASDNNDITKGFDDEFYAPHSRYTELKQYEIEKVDDLEILATSKKAGVYLVATKDLRHVFVTGHPEYDAYTLKNEYERDCLKGINPQIPENYFLNNDPNSKSKVTWRGHANLLFANWLNYAVYQKTDYLQIAENKNGQRVK